jgi:hypothetical protein
MCNLEACASRRTPTHLVSAVEIPVLYRIMFSIQAVSALVESVEVHLRMILVSSVTELNTLAVRAFSTDANDLPTTPALTAASRHIPRF